MTSTAMKQILATALLALCIGAAPADVIRPWLGLWSCTAYGKTISLTFSPIFGGNGMRVSGGGENPTEQIIVWDAKRRKWIDEYADASGGFNTMEGSQSANTMRFKQVYPAGDPAFFMTMTSKNRYFGSYTATENGKTITESETCTRR